MSFLPFLKTREKPVYFLQYHVLPVDEKFRQAGGAYVNCWICFKAADYICDLAAYYIDAAGWSVKRLLADPRLVTETDFVQDKFGEYCYREALEVGFSLSFYPWLSGQTEPDDICSFILERNKIQMQQLIASGKLKGAVGSLFR